MARVYPPKSNFTRGSITPLAQARGDLPELYGSSMDIVSDWLVSDKGPLRKRPPTKYVATAKNNVDAVRLVPFSTSTEQSYVLEMGDLYFRPYANQGAIAVEVVHPYTAAQVPEIHFTQERDTMFVAHPDVQPQEIGRVSDLVWTVEDHENEEGPYLNFNTTSTTVERVDAATRGGLNSLTPIMTSNSLPLGSIINIVNVTVPGNTWQVFDSGSNAIAGSVTGGFDYQIEAAGQKVVNRYYLQASNEAAEDAPSSWRIAATNDGITFTSLDSQTDQTSWRPGERRYFEFENDLAFNQYRFIWDTTNSGTAFSLAELAFNNNTDTVVLDFSSTTGINNDTGFVASDVGRAIRLLGGDNITRNLEITAVNSTTNVTAQWVNSFPMIGGATTQNWSLGAWSVSSGWPARTSIFKDRLWWGRTTQEPTVIWASKLNNFVSHGVSVPLVSTDAFRVDIRDAQEIQWLHPGSRNLQIGTKEAERVIGPADTRETISATNFTQERETPFPSSSIQPVDSGDATFFATLGRKKIRGFSFSAQVNGFTSPDRSILGQHLINGRVKEFNRVQDPDNIVFITTDDNKSIANTIEFDQQVSGFTEATMSGSVISQAAIPSDDGDDELWVLVERVINSVTVRYIEVIPFGDDPDTSVYLDSQISYSGVPISVVTGADHLEGETVGLYVDGVDVGDAVVTGGSVTLPNGLTGSEITLGLRYMCLASTLRLLSHGNQDGSAYGRRHNIGEVIIDVVNTGPGLFVATKSGFPDNGTEVISRTMDQNFDTPVPLYTGTEDVDLISDWTPDDVLYVWSDRAYPATIRAIIPAPDGEP